MVNSAIAKRIYENEYGGIGYGGHGGMGHGGED